MEKSRRGVSRFILLFVFALTLLTVSVVAPQGWTVAWTNPGANQFVNGTFVFRIANVTGQGGADNVTNVTFYYTRTDITGTLTQFGLNDSLNTMNSANGITMVNATTMTVDGVYTITARVFNFTAQSVDATVTGVAFDNTAPNTILKIDHDIITARSGQERDADCRSSSDPSDTTLTFELQLRDPFGAIVRTATTSTYSFPGSDFREIGAYTLGCIATTSNPTRGTQNKTITAQNPSGVTQVLKQDAVKTGGGLFFGRPAGQIAVVIGLILFLLLIVVVAVALFAMQKKR